MVYPVLSDEYFMNEALKEAQKAKELEEVPVGAVVVNQNRIIARGHNMTQQLNDVTAHAEMIAITSASNYPGTVCDVRCCPEMGPAGQTGICHKRSPGGFLPLERADPS